MDSAVGAMDADTGDLWTLRLNLLAQISVDVRLVTLVATVTDSNGLNVPNLHAEDFIVSEDGKEQDVTLVEQSKDLPVSMGIVLDTSLSMQPKMQTATDAIDRFLQSLLPDDDIFLMTFAEKPHMAQSFTTDRSKISNALHKVKLESNTALYSAAEQSVREARKGKHEKKAILLVTDGQDTSGKTTLDDVMDEIRKSHVLVYCLGIGPSGNTRIQVPTSGPTTIPGTQPGQPGRSTTTTPSITLPGGIRIPIPGTGPARRQFPSSGRGGRGGGVNGLDTVNMRVLEQIAEASGGKAWLIGGRSANGNTIDDALDEIASELRGQYTIGYHPNHPMNDGKWHQVTVRAKNPRYEVRARKEYFGGDSSAK